METIATTQPSSSGKMAAAADAYPGWVILAPYGTHEKEESYSAADANTLASSRTTTGHPIRAWLRLVPPPTPSPICVHFPEGGKDIYPKVIAAHGDSVLFQIVFEEYYRKYTIDHFVYNAGAAGAVPPRPPSLSLLPPYHLTEEEKKRFAWEPTGIVHRKLDNLATGLLRRGEDELVVAELKIVGQAAEIFLLRKGEWSVVRPTIRKDNQLPSSWETDSVIPVGDRWLCWVDLINGVIFLDVSDQEEPTLQYLSLLVNTYFGRGRYRNVCATASGDAVKFVNVFPRCCCGSAGASYCEHSHNAYTIHTWMLTMNDMTWVMDGMVDATELWDLDGYKGIPRAQIEYPVVSMDEPHAICFAVENKGDKAWLIMIDMRSKKLLSVSRYPERKWFRIEKTGIPCKVSYYLNSSLKSRNKGILSSASKSQMGIDALVDKVHINNDGSQVQPCRTPLEASVQELAILRAFQEIPTYGMDHEAMLKAYITLSHDDGRRLKSFLGLPRNLRKDWLLMEIKASES